MDSLGVILVDKVGSSGNSFRGFVHPPVASSMRSSSNLIVVRALVHDGLSFDSSNSGSVNADWVPNDASSQENTDESSHEN